ncbi:MAG: hypothetical protein HC869_09995 [Rhodospirillales bacterium]|nr:hypothetical protein [Rhodospirillales bacterium]
MKWRRITGWIVRSILIAFIALNAYGWLKILVLWRYYSHSIRYPKQATAVQIEDAVAGSSAGQQR